MDPSAAIDASFRTEWPRLIAVLVRDFGDLELAEESAAEAFLSATTSWQSSGVPERPGAWLLTTARRKAIDRMRRTTRFADKLSALTAQSRSASNTRTPDGLLDDQLALVLGCCHPALSREAQVALTLRAVAGLTTSQIAAAFLVPDATMGKRLTRARTKIRDAGIPFSVPDRTTLRERLDQVLQVVYLIFTEGHASSTEAQFVRGDLCEEALWLSELVADLVPDDADSQALAALIRLTDARRGARVDPAGQAVLLEDQDRSLWDSHKIAQGLQYLAKARQLGGGGTIYFQAAVAAHHSTATSFADTNWRAIVGLYDRQLAINPTPVLKLNRAVALGQIEGPEAALAEIDGLATDLADYVYFHSARAALLRRLGRKTEAIVAYDLALACDPGEGQAEFLAGQRAELINSEI